MTMRKIWTMLLTVAMGLAVGSCTEEIIGEGPSLQKRQTGEPVMVRMGVYLPGAAQTRAMDGKDGKDVTITQLWVAAFTDDHYLKQVAKATPCDAEGKTIDDFTPSSNPEDHGLTYFNVVLNTTDKKLTLHLVANYSLESMGFGMEGQLIGTLETTGNQDVYWQRVTNVPIVIDDDPDTGNLSNAQASPIQIKAPAELQEVPLVRNYATIRLVNNESKFKVTGYALTNLPDRGSVAPRISENNFASYYNGSKRNATCKSYAELLSQNYEGNEPFNVERATELTWVLPETDDDGNVVSIPDSYVYEFNNTRDERQTLSIIVRGKYDTDADETYYKLDLIYTDPTTYVVYYYNVLRNFQYQVNINEVNGSGFDSPEDAIAQPACNNLSGSTIVKSLTNISDGAYQLYVDKTSVVMVDENGEYTVRYRYVNLNPADGASPYENSKISVVSSYGEGHSLASEPTASAEDENGWITLTLKPNDPTPYPTGKKDETLTLVDRTRGLQRQVTLWLTPPYKLQLVAQPSNPPQVYNYPVTMPLYLPDGLPSSIFPLTFEISDENKTLYPQANTGMVVNVANGSYTFLRELTYAEYEYRLPKENNTHVGQNSHRLDLLMMTNALVSTTTVTVKNEYFETAQASITSQASTGFFKNVNISGTEYFGKNHTVTVKFTTNANMTGNVTLTFTEAASMKKDSTALAEHTETVTRNIANNGTYKPNTEISVSFTTQTFKGDITVTVSGGTDTNAQTITLRNPTKRHIIHIPEHSFWFESQWAGYYTWRGGAANRAIDDKGVFEWPDILIDGYESGSRKIYPTRYTGSQDAAGTTAYKNDAAYPKALLDIDAQYGGRDVDFYPDSKVRFEAYYLYDEKGAYQKDEDGNYLEDEDGNWIPYDDQPRKQPYYECTLEDITNAWNPTLGIIDFKIDFRTDD